MSSPTKQDSKGKKTEADPDQIRVQATDNPRTILVSIVFDSTNFLSWSRSIKIALRAKMKLGFINGKNPKPQESDDGFELWERADGMVISWILNSISKDIVESFLYIDTVRDLWVELESRYGVSNGPMIYQLQREIASAAQDQRKKGVTTNNRALNATNGQTEDQESVQNAMDNEAISEVVRNEVRRMVRQDGTGTCNRRDTFAEYDDYAGNFLANSVLESSKCWIVDSGATSHMCNNINIFHKIKENKPGAYIHLADGSKQHVKAVGSVSLSGNLELSDVLHVPTLKFNLLSVSKLCDNTYIRFEFFPICCLLQNHRTSKTVAVGKLIGKLYILDEHSFKTDTIRHIIEQVQDVGLLLKLLI
ncbi:UNVERIFIED_CONTAM: Retrovirus-related Pol polyprotein from transposon RE1 [Sesamum radiatum]|uniref:Retrovirus-related Pol polyprotein from transposon RE1 n=1 Tax=Sesamum radiatum TaxID=300843 RepID=A0AAW2VLW4_SESRA